MFQKVEVSCEMGGGIVVTHSFEQAVDNIDEAHSYGKDCAHLMKSFNDGFGEADLSE